MKVATGFNGGDLATIGADARAVEDLGYDQITFNETKYDSMLSSAFGAAATQRATIATGVTIAFPRSPMVLAMEAWDIQKLSKGRYRLGLGSQVKGHNERRFSVPWSAPAPRMKEYIQAVRAAWTAFDTGEMPSFQGKHYQLTLLTPEFNPGPIGFTHPKIALACVGEGMTRVAAEVADVVLPHGFMTEKYMRNVLLPHVAVGLKRAGKTWTDIEIPAGGAYLSSAGGFSVWGENESEIEQGLEGMKQNISFYSATRTYHGVLEQHGLVDFGMELHHLSVQGKWQEMEDRVQEKHLRELVATSTFDNLPDFIREHREYAGTIGIGLPAATPQQQERARHIIRTVQAVEVPRVPRGLEDIEAVAAKAMAKQ